MRLRRLLGSKRTRQLNAAAMLAEAWMALRRGDLRLALLYAAGAIVSYKNTAAGFLGQALLRAYRRTRRRPA